jgi:hypothetical protein
MIGRRDTPYSRDGVAGLNGPLALCDGDDDQLVVSGLRPKRQQPLAARKGGFEILVGNSLAVVVGLLSGLQFHHDGKELPPSHRPGDRRLQPIGERADRLLRDAKVGIRVGPLVQCDDCFQVGLQCLGRVSLRDLLRG